MHEAESHAATERLRVALWAAVAELAIQLVVLAARGALTVTPLRGVFLALKLVFCWGAWHRRPGAFLAVWLWEIGAVVAAIGVHGALLPRSGIAAMGVVVMVLLGRATSAFPSVEWSSR